MNPTAENEDIATTVAGLRSRFDMPVVPAQRGPVPLGRLVNEFNLLHVTLPRLTRRAIVEYLLGEGIMPGDLIGTDEPDEVLAGFLFARANDGLIFIGEQEQRSVSDEGESAAVGQTPLGRRRFTVAHELGHFSLHRDGNRDRLLFGDTWQTVSEQAVDSLRAIEKQANRFAVELLMPREICFVREDEFRRAYGACPRTPFAYYLAAELLVSSVAMRYRLSELGVGDE